MSDDRNPLIMPIEIRPDYFVRIAGIPHDLTVAEAEKIARVVIAMAIGGHLDHVAAGPILPNHGSEAA